MTEDNVSLEVEAERTTALLQSAQDRFLPLAVAAAIAFHQAHGNTRAIVTRRDYDDALNIAAAALSRLIAVYVVRAPREERTRVAVDLARGHFARGATELRNGDGTIRDLSVTRSELLSALSLIKRIGLPFSFAIGEDRQRGV